MDLSQSDRPRESLPHHTMPRVERALDKISFVAGFSTCLQPGWELVDVQNALADATDGADAAAASPEQNHLEDVTAAAVSVQH